MQTTDRPRIDAVYPSLAADLSDDDIAARFERSDRATPWLRANFISSIDGAATHGSTSGGLGDSADKRVFDIVRALADVVIVGAGTVRTEGYGPMVLDEASAARRGAAGLAPHPVFAIVSRSLDLDPDSRIFRDAPVRPIVATVASAPAARRLALSAVADVIECGDDGVEPERLIAALVSRGLTQLHCEGGPSLFGDLLAADVVDELCLTVSPRLESGNGRRIATGALAGERMLHLGHVLVSGDTLLLRYTRG